MKIGCHLSTSGGFMGMARDTLSIGGNTFQYFSRNPRGGGLKAVDSKDIENFLSFAGENGIGQILAHAPYTLNPASNKEQTLVFARNCLSEDLARMELIPGSLYNFHPGSHVGQGIDKGIELVCGLLNQLLSEEMTTTVLLETMAGKGSEIGGSFQHLGRIIKGTDHNQKLGVCLDTCHVYDGGYDIKDNLDGVLEEFDRQAGLHRLKAIHLNDSKNPFASHKDRHEKIGKGSLGIETFRKVVNHPSLEDLPFFLETPNDQLSGYGEEIALLKTLIG